MTQRDDGPAPGLPSGGRMAVDVGTVRIGVATAAAGSTIAVPTETVVAGPDAVARIVTLIGESAPGIIYVGDPLRLDGTVGPAALAARDFARQLTAGLTVGNSSATVVVEVRMVDERLTSAQSHKQMRAAGRDTRRSRSVLDQAAAVAILQNALDRERATGQPAGVPAEQDQR